MDRRNFFTILGNTTSGIVTLGALGVTFEFLKPNVLKEIPTQFKVGPVSNIQPGTVIFQPEHRLFLVRKDDGAFYAVSSICTHLGCTTKWIGQTDMKDSETAISCPCHGSKFNKIGDVLQGPAPRPLERYKLSLAGDRIVINTKAIVTEEEMYLKV